MANEHPFQMLFETLGRLPIAHADSVNRHAYELLYEILSVPVEKSGRCILLRAPRAGHGKTHLLSRIQHHLGATHEFIPLHPAFGCQIDAATVIDDTLRRLLRPLPASGGLCVLDLVTRRLFAAALQPLVGSGEVPCQDREGALTALRTRPIETFDFHHPNAVTAHWARENFEVLGQRLSVELAQRCDLPIREVSFWVEALFRFAATPVENPVRLRVLAEIVHAGNPGDGVLMERLEALLGMLAQLMRVVLVADDLEGFSADETAALRLAAFLGALRQSVERLDVVLSLNQDIWQSAFVPRLSGGLTDRLSEVVVELNPLSEDEMVALLESRVPGLGARVLSRVDQDASRNHARGLIRAAGVAWLRASAMDSQSTSPPVPPVMPPPVVSQPTPGAPEPVADTSPAEPEPRFEPVVAGEPVAPIPTAEPNPPPEAPVQVERTPDPTLAISFLAAEAAAASTWPSSAVSGFETEPEPIPAVDAIPQEIVQPVFQGSYNPEAPVFEPAPAVVIDTSQTSWPSSDMATFQPEPAPQPLVFEAAPPSDSFVPSEPAPPVFQAAAPQAYSFEPAPEPANPPVFAPVFEAAPEPVAQPVWQPAPEFTPAPAFEAAPETFNPPVYQAPPPEVAPAPVFQPVPESPLVPESEPAAQAFEPATTPAVPDTDRVDDLLRQFRERYGRGSM